MESRPPLEPNIAIRLLPAVIVAVPLAASAAEAGAAGAIHWAHLLMGLFGGLALFLFGMEQMSDALKSALGNQMKALLAKLTRNRITAALTGTFVTAVIQSSSVTTVLVVGFVSAGMMTMSQSIGVIMGANVGTTITAQIVAFKVEAAALWMIAIGFCVLFTGKGERIKHYGNMLMGLGLIFYGMGLMGGAMRPLRTYAPFLQMMTQMDQPLLALAVGALFTALVQSSSATTAVVITMASQGLITLETGIVLAFGANIGTCITAQLAALGKPREALRAAVVHLLFNVGGVLIWLPFVSLLAGVVSEISPAHPELAGTARLAAEVPRQIANAHTLFNVANMILFLCFTGTLARLVAWLVPDTPTPPRDIIRSKYLEEALLVTPALALQRARLETAHMAEILQKMFSGVRRGLLTQNRAALTKVRQMDDQLDILQGEILQYLGAIRTRTLTAEESRELVLTMKAASHLESLGDVIETELVGIGFRSLELGKRPGKTARFLFNMLGARLDTALEEIVNALGQGDQRAASRVLAMKVEIDQLLAEALEVQSRSLAEVCAEDVEGIRMEMTAMENIKRIYTHLKRVAREIVPPAVQP
ncbi:MAG: Na/Pi cotransporter family protein [Desulfosarcinaceae bacterium]|nr:Na/Pi cotransporter family protein [Desulfosarcinaceae bacterium]